MAEKETKLKQKLHGAVKKMIDDDVDEWPPDCFLFIYQPTRPELTPKEAAKNKPE